MSTSSGGGYCDCGDSEAWKQHESCTVHAPSKVTEDPGYTLPGQDSFRAYILFEFIVEYAMLLLTYAYAVNPPVPFCVNEDEIERLDIKSLENLHACILYNDESHTFEVVIQTLTKALETSKRNAIDFATQIDRDGRAIVKSGTFEECKKVKELIETHTSRNGNNPLRTDILHGFVVSHQHVAMRLLEWLREIVAISSGYRYVFFQVLNSKYLGIPEGQSNLEVLMSSDTKFWKTVRVQWHHLFISGLLKEYYMKKVFASSFGKLYAELMKDFITDDHDHIYSVSALSVQIFTVPTLAHFLIEEHDVFYTILRTFVSECEVKLNAGKVKFDSSTPQFKRTHFAIMDLKYLLTTPPTTWTSPLRKSFAHGMELFVKLLSYLQETDPVLRQTGTHVEFEPEWEAAFNTHIKLSPVIALILDWCATSRKMCVKSYRLTTKAIADLKYNDQMTTIVRELADHSATCYEFDIASRPVSIHLALTRLYAGLCVHLERFNLSPFDSEVHIGDQPTHEILMEPALRALCLSAQCHAGMWKRNGYSLMNQMYFYHNVRCRADMYDRDVVALQIGASVIESNEFLIHVLNRLGMCSWAEDTFDSVTKEDEPTLAFTVLLAEEFFQLIITLVSARFSPGVGVVTTDDCVRKQIVQALCIHPMQHSELNKLLVEDVYGETGIEVVIKAVTTCKRTTQGDVYELLPQYYSEYDVFHHHYTREDMSKAEQQQRSRKKTAKEPDCFPPPKLPLFTSNFTMVVNVLKSDVLLHVMSLVLKRGLQTSSRSFSDPQLRRVLHLIGLALNEEIARSEIEAQHFFQFTEAAKKWNIFTLLEEMLQDSKSAIHKDFVVWLLDRYREIQPDHRLDTGIGSEEENARVKENQKKFAAERRAFLLANMNQQQQNFRTVNEELFKPDNPNAVGGIEDVEMVPEDAVALGVNQTRGSYSEEFHKCILCQEEQDVSETSSVFVLACYVQQSSVHAQDRKYLVDCVTDERCQVTLEPLSPIRSRDSLILHADLMQSVHVGSCGHEMHLCCFNKYFESVQTKERRRPYRFRHPVSFDIEDKEYLCPLCERLSNCTLPMVPQLDSLQPPVDLSKFELNYSDFLDHLSFLVENTKEVAVDKGMKYDETGEYAESEETLWVAKIAHKDSKGWSEVQRARNEQIWPADPNIRRLNVGRCPLGLAESGIRFQKTVYELAPRPTRKKNDGPKDTRKISRKLLGFWQSVAFTITSAEMLHREQGIPFFGSDIKASQWTMTYLVRAAGVSIKYSDELSVNVLKSLGWKLLGVLLQTGPDGARNISETMLDVDAFSLLVSLTLTVPYLFEHYTDLDDFRNDCPIAPSCGRMEDFFLIKTTLMYHITQVILQSTSDPGHSLWLQHRHSVFRAETGIEWNNNFSKFISAFLTQEEKSELNEPNYWSVVYSGIMKTIVPFLRCCCKFYECLTGIQPRRLLSPEASYTDMLAYLGLPTTANELFDPIGPLVALMHRWRLGETNGESYRDLKEIPRITRPFTYPRKAAKLVDLPLDYMDLINSVSSYTCRNSESCLESRMPTMCLVCGIVLCSQSYCCQKEMKGNTVGACTFHSYVCGSGVGIFLRIRDCKVFFLGGKMKDNQNNPRNARNVWDHENLLKGIYVAPPYLDEYGESDPGLRRGNPMKLDVEKYKHLRRLWLNHGIPAEISRHTERSTSVVTTEWQYL